MKSKSVVRPMNEEQKLKRVAQAGKDMVAFAVLMMVFSANAHAAMSLGWEGALCGLAGALTGPTAIGVATIAFGAAAVGFVFGEQLQGIMKAMVNVVIGTGLLLGSSAVVAGLAKLVPGATATACTAAAVAAGT